MRRACRRAAYQFWLRGTTRRDEPSREGAHTQHNAHSLGRAKWSLAGKTPPFRLQKYRRAVPCSFSERSGRQRRPVIVAHIGRRRVLQERLYDLLVALAIDY